MKPSRILAFALLAIVMGVFALPVQAQVATMDLNPGQALFVHPKTMGANATSFTPHNPAALQWAENSSVGLGRIDGEAERGDAFGIFTQTHDGGFGGVRIVGEYAALGVSKLSAEGQDQGFPSTYDSTAAAFSLNLGGTLAIGVGVDNILIRQRGQKPPPPPGVFENQEIAVEVKTAGLSLNFDNGLFLGYATGKRTMEFSLPDFNITAPAEEGDFTKKGVALRTLGEWKWYLEHYVLDFQTVGKFNGTAIKTATTALQTNYKGFLLGFSATEVEVEKDLNKPNREHSIDLTTVELGWVPFRGLAYTVRVITLKSHEFDPTLPNSTVNETLKTTTAAVSYSF